MEQTALRQQLKALPARPGVYLLKDSKGNVLYVGKAASLKHRVRSYFSGPQPTTKLERLVPQVSDLETMVTDSEQEALLLECNLIKKHRPRYNVRLKDDKSYPYLKIDLTDEWPRVYMTRRYENDGSRYLGPFASAGSLRQTLKLVKRLFPFRSCSKPITGADGRACLEYDINRCVAPCIGAVNKEEYQQVIKQVLLFLEGKQEQVLQRLRRAMEQAAEKLEFEKAAVLRDQLQSLERVMQSQKVAGAGKSNQDVVAMVADGDQTYVEVFFIRNGKLIGREHFILEGTQDEAPSLALSSFIQQFYASASYIPPLVLLQHPVDNAGLLETWLSTKRGGAVRLHVPQRGRKRELVEMVAENARQGLAQLRLRWLADADSTRQAVSELAEKLGLPQPPGRIECYDISDIRGTAAVGSMVVFIEGQPSPRHYRRFRIKTVSGADDYAMIQEMLRRRFRRGALAEGDWANQPGLVLIDGGKGHLSAALEVMAELGVASVPLATLAKEREEVFLPGSSGPVMLPRHSSALYLLQRIRDEAHRFALSYHHRLRRSQSLGSTLDSVPGIGPRRKRALLRKFGSLPAIKGASVAELAATEGMTTKLAERLKQYL